MMKSFASFKTFNPLNSSAYSFKLPFSSTIQVKGNLYFSKSCDGGFSSHDHSQYDVFIKQIYGTSHWVLSETEDVILPPGDVLHIPKGTKHYVKSTDGPRLSLTINMQ